MYTVSQGTEIYQVPIADPNDVVTDIGNGVYGDDVYTVSQGTETYQVPIADPNDLYETYDAVTDIVTNNPLAKKRPPPAFSNC